MHFFKEMKEKRHINIHRRIILLSSLLSLLFTNCIKDDVPVIAHVPGDIQTVQIEIGYPYTYQVYYNCETNSVVNTNTKYDWDLSFECTQNGNHILLNTAKGMLACNSGSSIFDNVSDTIGSTWLWDAPSGNLDSTAVNNWQGSNNIYIVDRQYDENGNHMGYKKIQFQSVNNQNYTFKFADLNGNNEVTYTIQKNQNLNFIHFTFDNGGQTLVLEPNKNEWDLLFTNHHHKFSNLPLPFVLTQVLSNKHNDVIIAEDNNNSFSTIELKDSINYIFTDIWDEIGYDWKIRNSQDNSFTIDANKSFILKTTNGFFYKIRFIDFYNNTGVKGYPTFEIQKL